MDRNMSASPRTRRFLLMAIALILSLVGACFGEVTLAATNEIKAGSSSEAPPTTVFIRETKPSAKPLEFTVAPTQTSNTNETTKITKAYVSSESPTTVPHSTTKVYASTKGVVKSARKQKLNTSSSALGAAAHSPARLQERLGAVDCDLPVLPRESRLWRGNETHELNLPVTVIRFNIIFIFELYLICILYFKYVSLPFLNIRFLISVFLYYF